MITAPIIIETQNGQIERTEDGDLILSYFMLCFAIPDEDGEMRDWETGGYTNVRDLMAFPFLNSKPSKENVESSLKLIYGERLDLLEMQLEEQKVCGKTIWQRPGLNDTWF